MELNLEENKNQENFSEESVEQETKNQNENLNQPEFYEVEKQLDACKQELSNWKDKYLRAQADLDNFQKRITKERVTWTENAQAKIFKELLTVVDNFERAFSEDQKAEKDEALQGFEIIYKTFQKMLADFGVKKMDNYATFDPAYHEALVQVESDQHESGQIVEVLQQGYVFKEHVLRPAKVSVAR